MLVAQDFRDEARRALSGKWALSVGTGFVATLLGAGTMFMASSSSSDSVDAEKLEQLPEEVAAIVATIMLVIMGIELIYALVTFIIGGPITLGYVKYNLNLVDDDNPQFGDLFSMFNRFGEGFLVQFLRSLYIFLWAMLFIVPIIILTTILLVGLIAGTDGAETLIIIFTIVLIIALIPVSIFLVVKQYSYALAPYILYENPGMGANNAIKESKELMNGNKWRLFCLCFSFIGWSILCVFTLGIGTLWLKPYQEAAYAAFYREIKRERYGEPVQQYTTNSVYY